MNWWQNVVVLCSLVTWVRCQAPGDGDAICLPGGALGGIHPVYPNAFKPLMDSRDYANLLDDAGAVWQQVDVDGLGDGTLQTSWSQPTNLLCRQAVYVCGFGEPGQDNWLITQHISREVGGTLLNQVVIVAEFEFNSCIETGECAQLFSIHRYSTSTIDPATAANVDNYELLDTIAPDDVSGHATVYLDFDQDDNTTGFYLAIRDMSTCVFIHRVLVYYAVCPNVIQDLVNLPETIAPAQNLVGPSEIFPVTTGTCVENSSPEFGQPNPEVNCLAGGQWNPRFECLCNNGFYSNGDSTGCLACVAGEYASAGDGSCLPCPANSDSEAEATICDCNEGYYRSDTEGPEDGCTQCPIISCDPPTVVDIVPAVIAEIMECGDLLVWEPPQGEVDYYIVQIYYKNSRNTRKGVQNNFLRRAWVKLSQDFDDLTQGVTYYVRVRAKNSAGDSPWSMKMELPFSN